MRIIFRVTDKVFGVHAQHRFFSDNKTEIALRCYKSLLNNLNNCRDNVEIVVVADRASDRLLEGLGDYDVLMQRSYSGLKESILDSFAIANEKDSDWTFFVEDDYLFRGGAFDCLLPDLKGAFKHGAGFRDYPGIILHPSDYSDRYTREGDVQKRGHIMRPADTYYRQIYNTTMTVLMNAYALRNATMVAVPLMEQLQQGQGFDAVLSELYQRSDMLCVSPIPSFAFHLDNHNTMPPLINWREVWEGASV